MTSPESVSGLQRARITEPAASGSLLWDSASADHLLPGLPSCGPRDSTSRIPADQTRMDTAQEGPVYRLTGKKMKKAAKSLALEN